MKRATNILTIAFILFLVACGGGGGSSDSSGSGSSIESLMVGTWKSVCINIGGPEPYITITITYSDGGSTVETVIWHTDPACASPTGLMKINQSAYSFGANLTASGKNAYQIDVTQNSWILSQNGVTMSSGSTPIMFYDIIAIEGDRLYEGEGRAGATAGERPTTLDLAGYYTRQ